MKKTLSGFTLIELLVVIAIIGILSSVVLASLNTARGKGRDSAVLANMDSISPQAVLYQDINQTYGTSANDCTAGVFSDPKLQSILQAVALQNNNAAPTCYANDTTYSIALERPAGNGFTPTTVYWCIDSTGRKCGVNDTSSLASTGLCGCP
jgi:prepilin-type N-terminal cleavage/methylation domain-containing protein